VGHEICDRQSGLDTTVEIPIFAIINFLIILFCSQLTEFLDRVCSHKLHFTVFEFFDIDYSVLRNVSIWSKTIEYLHIFHLKHKVFCLGGAGGYGFDASWAIIIITYIFL
jgi:hypothetical protein